MAKTRIVVDGNDGTGKSTLVASLHALGIAANDRGEATAMTIDPSAEPHPRTVYLILDCSVETSRARLAAAGKNLDEKYHTVADLTRFRAKFLEVAERLPRHAVIDASGTEDQTLGAALEALRQYGIG